MPKSIRLLAASGALVMTGALGLAGCTSSTTPSEESDMSAQSAAPTMDQQSDQMSSGEQSGTGAATTTHEMLLSAARVAEGQVPGSKAAGVDLERDLNQWEVKVIGPDGTSYQVMVSIDGENVVSEAKAQQESDSDRSEHLERLAGAELDLAGALDRLEQEFPGAAVEEISLDSDGGKVVWEIDLIDGAGAKQDVTLDAQTGELVKTEQNS